MTVRPSQFVRVPRRLIPSHLRTREPAARASLARIVTTVEEDEVSRILDDLETILEELGYSAVVEQERRAAAAGRVVETTKEDRARYGTRGQGRPEIGDVRRTPLTARERLAMLLDLVEVAVGGTFSIEERVLDFALTHFAGSVSEGRTPTFRPDSAEGFAVADDRQWALPDREVLESRREHVRQVLNDLDELRNAVGVERDPILTPESPSRSEVESRILGWA